MVRTFHRTRDRAVALIGLSFSIALDGLIVAIQTQAKHLGKKASWTRKIVLITDGESEFATSDWETTAEKLNELEVYTTIMCVQVCSPRVHL